MPNNNIQKPLFGCVDEFPNEVSSNLAFEIIREIQGPQEHS